MKLDKDIIIIDIEGTGLNGMKYSVCELGAVRLNTDGEEVSHFHSDQYIRPLEDKFLPEAMATHGISWKTLQKAPTFEQVIAVFEAWCKEHGDDFILASWGIIYDITFMQCQYHKTSRKWPFSYRYLDIRSLAKWETLKLGLVDDFNLMGYMDIWDIDQGDDVLHSAIGDVRMTVRLFQKLMNISTTPKDKSIHEIVRDQKCRDYYDIQGAEW